MDWEKIGKLGRSEEVQTCGSKPNLKLCARTKDGSIRLLPAIPRSRTGRLLLLATLPIEPVGRVGPVAR
eukprot:4502921-Amphidinium_carterae.1